MLLGLWLWLGVGLELGLELGWGGRGREEWVRSSVCVVIEELRREKEIPQTKRFPLFFEHFSHRSNPPPRV